MLEVINGLTNEELAQKILANGISESSEDLETLFQRNLGLIAKVARHYSFAIEEPHVMQQLGYIAVMNAVKAYKLSKPYPFIAYLNKCATHLFYEYALDMHSVYRIPRSYKKVVGDSDPMNVSVIPIQNYTQEFSTGPESDSECIAAYSNLQNVLWSEIDSVLSPINASVIRARFIENKSLAEIGNKLGIGKERVRQRELRSLQKLSHSQKIQQLAQDYFCIHTPNSILKVS